MPSDRLALALDRLTPGDWQVFEQFAAEFLAVEYPSLRTTAAPAGDRGRDGQLYNVAEEPRVAIQYSVTSDWRSKINQTVSRLRETMPSVQELIYATNQAIGPSADDLVRALRKRDVYIDIRDRSWFVERELTAPQREVASRELTQRMVDPLLVERRIREHSPVLSNEEARIALLHLTLDAQDEASDKGLTKTCFESLVLSALYDTTPETRRTLEAITTRVARMLPAGFETQIAQRVKGAIQRLSARNGPVKQHGKSNEYFLSQIQREAVQQKAAEYLLFQDRLQERLVAAIKTALPGLQLNDEALRQVGKDLRVALETVLLKRGEAFAGAAKTGEIQQVDAGEVLATVARINRESGRLLTNEQVATATIEVLERPYPEVRQYLHRLADAYTMFAFLRQAPDVQKVVVSMFSGGDLWLDTSMILPLLAETLLEDPLDRYYTALIKAAKDAGLRLYVTDGVVEEVERHINRCVVFSRSGTREWRSGVPFLSTVYALSGRARSGFDDWAERFRGRVSPQEDVRQYLFEVYGVDRRNLLAEADAAPTELRAAVQEVWHETHERRRVAPGEEELDPATRHRLVAHDVENSVGIIQLRKQTSINPLGYRSWWLTLDKIALSLHRELKQRLGNSAPASPAISPDFMSQYLRIGPLRTAVERELWAGLPLITDISRYAFLPKELIDRADELRVSHAGLDEHVIRRRVRDDLNETKLRRGPASLGGIQKMEEVIQNNLRNQARAAEPRVPR
ncbi:hypothetical protein KBX26_08510 [Micromonospora sp. C97]|uniref:hypothetical protein n=1 Tax=Micromonospora sp. C97 TaxID=2824883 RepID=UPI001B365122|nr:hypothetical protein [Micromonospora sp. C97]MBQ1030042.1 hypothetical protein [Micromonospora sp. C97]